MKRRASRLSRGATLIEAVIAIGVLAVAIPMVFGAMAEGGKSGMSSKAEAHSTWIVPLCMAEIQSSRAGRSRNFPRTLVGEVFPPAGEVWVLGFSAKGQLVGKVAKADYEAGVGKVDGKTIHYLASISATVPAVSTGATRMLTTKVSLEYPAAAPWEKRQKLNFYSRIP
jgi:hypothetical protein